MTPELNASLNALILEVGTEIASDVRAKVERAIVEAKSEGARVERAEWKPIETAPKDGRRILLGVAGFEETSSGYWDRDPIDENGQCWRDDGCERIEPPPTHWMRLPDPPQVVEPEGNQSLAQAEGETK